MDKNKNEIEMIKDLPETHEVKREHEKAKSIVKAFGKKRCKFCKLGIITPVHYGVECMEIPDIKDDSKYVPSIIATCNKCGFSAFWNQRIVLGE